MDPDPYWIRIRIGIQPKMLDPDPDEMNADLQPWYMVPVPTYNLRFCSIPGGERGGGGILHPR